VRPGAGGRAAHDQSGWQESRVRRLFIPELREEVPSCEQALLDVRLVDGS